MKIRDLVSSRGSANLRIVSPGSSLLEAAHLLTGHNVGALVVIGEFGRMVGIVSERDLIRAMAKNHSAPTAMTVGDVMTRSVVTCSENQAVAAVFALMKTNSIRHIPVLRDGVPVDMISIRELPVAYEQALSAARTDVLTGLANRRHFLECLDGEIARSTRYGHALSVAMLDIDHFKHVNDTHGHDGGDRVLRALSDVVARQLRTTDKLGRMGGEEFGLYLPETDLAGAKIACGRILDAVRAERIAIDQTTVRITVSMGLHTQYSSRRGARGADAAALLATADRLLYAAKAGGRNRVVSDDDAPPSPASNVVPLPVGSVISAA